MYFHSPTAYILLYYAKLEGRVPRLYTRVLVHTCALWLGVLLLIRLDTTREDALDY